MPYTTVRATCLLRATIYCNGVGVGHRRPGLVTQKVDNCCSKVEHCRSNLTKMENKKIRESLALFLLENLTRKIGKNLSIYFFSYEGHQKVDNC